MKSNKQIGILAVTLLAPVFVRAQQERADIRQGNRAYYEGKYPQAEVEYKRALDKYVNSYEAQYNLGGTLYKQGRYDDAAAAYAKLMTDGTDPVKQAQTYYNLGNTLLKQRKLDDAIEAYKNTLRLTPNDKEAKFNLAYAKKLKQEDDNKKNQDDNQDQNQDNNQDQNQDQNQNQDPKSDPNKNNPPPKEPNNQQQPPPPSASRPESERLLNAIQANEDKTKKRVDQERAAATASQGGRQW